MALFFHLYGSWSDSAAKPHLITIQDAASRLQYKTLRQDEVTDGAENSAFSSWALVVF
jgi:hypothetical protein